jgi:hypothetical protein
VYERGLSDRLARLLAHLDTDLGLDAAGRHAAFDSVLELVTNRALLLADRERYPAIAEERIERPITVTGLPRSGTTLMHALLAEHPGNRAPLLWEVVRPSPPPGISAPDDPRVALADVEVAEWTRQQPTLLQFHPYFDRLSHTIMECEAFGALDLRNVYNTAYFRVPAVLQVQLGGEGHQDQVAVYAFQRQVLQALQWQRPARRWALKGTEHHARLGGLKEVFPDAIVVWLHRDPLRFVPSLLELLSGWFEGVLGQPIDRPVMGPVFLGMYKAMLDAGLASPLVDHPDVCHVLYADFIKDPVAQIGGIYERYALPFTAEAERAMRSWYDNPANRGDRHGKVAYSLEAFGMTADDIDSLLAGYRARFAIPYE